MSETVNVKPYNLELDVSTVEIEVKFDGPAGAAGTKWYWGEFYPRDDTSGVLSSANYGDMFLCTIDGSLWSSLKNDPNPGDWIAAGSLQGPTGATGPPGPLGAHFVYEQLSPNATWNIEHDLGKFPSVMVVDTGNTVIEPDIAYLSENQIQIQFGSPTSGKAYLN